MREPVRQKKKKKKKEKGNLQKSYNNVKLIAKI